LRACFDRARGKLEISIELALLCAIVVTIAASLTYAVGWISPGPITPATIIEGLQAHAGFPSFRGSR